MRCVCCNRNLSDIESTRRHAITGEFLDICSRCLPDTEIPYIDRDDLNDTLEDDEAEDTYNPLPEMQEDWERHEGE